MVKTTSNSSFEHQQFALHIDQFSRRFVVRAHKRKPAILSCVVPKSSSTCHLTSPSRPFQCIQDSTPNLDPTEQNEGTKIQESSKDEMAFENILEDPTPIVLVPQGFWDDLFEKALETLNTVPIEEDPKI